VLSGFYLLEELLVFSENLHYAVFACSHANPADQCQFRSSDMFGKALRFDGES
jgi:hypothetical protein